MATVFSPLVILHVATFSAQPLYSLSGVFSTVFTELDDIGPHSVSDLGRGF